MAEQRWLASAPIREAVLDLRTHVVPDDLEPTLKQLAESLDGYQDPERLRLFEGNVQIPPDGEPEAVFQRLKGFRVSSDDETRVVQFKVDGFAFSRLTPYTNWDDVADEARELWERYARAVEPDTVTRIAVRYINHIRLPHPIREIDEYFTSLPRLPEALPQVLSSFLTRVTIFEEEQQFSAHVSHALVDDIDPDRLGVLLDIDAFRQGVLEPDADELWETFESLRAFKNLIFFESITERTAEMFE